MDRMTFSQHIAAHDERALAPLVRRKWRLVLVARLAVACAIGLLALDAQRLGPDAKLLAIAIAASVVPWHLLMLGLTLRPNAAPWYLSFVDATIIAAASTLAAPHLWPMALLAGPAIVAIEAGLAGRGWATASAIWTVGVFGAAGVLSGADYIVPSVVGLGLACGAIALVSGHSTTERETRLARQSALLDQVPALVWEAKPNGAAIFVRGHIRELLSYTRSEWDQRDGFASLIHPDDRSVFRTPAELKEPGGSATREFRMRHRDGQWVWLRDSMISEVLSDGGIGLRGVSVDITAEKQAQRAIARFGSVLDQIQTPLHILELESDYRTLRLVSANAAGKSLDLTDPELLAACRRALDTGQKIISLDEGYEIWPLDDTHLAVVLAAPDVHRQVPSQDALTSLPDRAAMRTRLDEHLRLHPDARLALLVLDLNQFKEVNDTLGHAQGDQLLRLVAARVLDVAAPGDMVCRLGGDEFALLLVQDGPERAQLVAADLGTAIAHPIVLNGVHIQAGVSIGASMSPIHGSDADLLLQRADVAMYQAKSAGESYRLYDPNDDRFTVRRLTLLGELPRALRNNELVVHYQPKIDLRTSSVVGVEALVRWQHPDHGMIAPDEFIELAEVSGLVRELTRQVIEESLAQVREWDSLGIHLSVAVNLSVRNFTDADLPIWVEQSLARHGISPTRLMLEITESEIMDDVVLALGVLERLSALGIRSSIDDFGTGYSSLSYLRQLPIDEIKIDRSFVGTMAVNQSDTVIVRSIIELGHNLGHAVVAEGVEDEWTLDSLRALGCDEAQGYYFSRPVPANEIPGFVSAFAESTATAGI
jgi:diguanylate cyclase (GGDEF)-like protein/PAS domain S-box-containing protein